MTDIVKLRRLIEQLKTKRTHLQPPSWERLFCLNLITDYMDGNPRAHELEQCVGEPGDGES